MNLKYSSIVSIVLILLGFILWIGFCLRVEALYGSIGLLDFCFSLSFLVFGLALSARFKQLRVAGGIYCLFVGLELMDLVLAHFYIETFKSALLQMLNVHSPLMNTFVIIFLLKFLPVFFLLSSMLKLDEFQRIKTPLFISSFSITLWTVLRFAFTYLVYNLDELNSVSPVVRGFAFSSYEWANLILSMVHILCLYIPFAVYGEKLTGEDKPVLSYEELTQPMSVKDWIKTYLVSMIPLVNIILLLMWAFGSYVNVNKKNWARASLIIMLIVSLIYCAIIGFMILSRLFL